MNEYSFLAARFPPYVNSLTKKIKRPPRFQIEEVFKRLVA